VNSPLKFAAPYGVQFKDFYGNRCCFLLESGALIASFSVEKHGSDEAAYEAAWHHLYGPSNELIAQSIAQDVAELSDRTSPEDQPEMMLVTAEELQAIVLANLNPT